MAKPTHSNSKVAIDLSGLLKSAIADLGGYLHGDDLLELSARVTDPVGFLSSVSGLLDRADAMSSYRRYCALRQLEAFLKKNVDLPGTSASGRKLAAMRTFYASERKCRRTNKRLAYYLNRPSRMPRMVAEVLRLAREYVHSICGPLERSHFQEILECSGFGPGFTFSSSEQEHRHLYYKVAGPHSVTREALPYVKVLLNHCQHWKQSLVEGGSVFDVVRGNRVTSVPKTAVTDRTIAIEPSLNVYIQKGVDAYLKGKLRRFGVTLTKQERNHAVARRASMRPLHAATVDLSSASDNVSVELVRYMLPSNWFVLLDDLRSHEYTTDKGKTWTRYEKFSSMGNAFTFPLESMLFYALAKACTVISGGVLKRLRVYGDDIIVDPRAVLLLYEVLGFVGFAVNRSKSYCFGPFRETCGKDFLAGVDTRPVYMSKVPDDDQEVYNLYNRLLWNRVGFRMDSVHAYLFKAVRRPLIGPPDLPAGERFESWAAGKSVIHDRYFHAPPEAGERFKRYDTHLQRFVWRIKILRFTPKKIDTSNWDLQFWYLAFLLGVSGKPRVDSVSMFRRSLSDKLFVRWETPPYVPLHYDCVMEASVA